MAADELRSLGFHPAGRFVGGRFELAPEWRGRQGVYVWETDEGPIRVGIAMGPDGFWNRYVLYNRWLDGRFKPDDAQEQQKRALFQSRLNAACQLWAIDTADKAAALELEKVLRTRWGAVLSLDLTAAGSWAKLEMKKWRDQLGGKAAANPRSPQREGAPPGGVTSSPGAKAIGPVQARLDRMLTGLGLTPTAVSQGVSYKLGGSTLCRIDPKQGFLRVHLGLPAEAAAPSGLRASGKRRGWLIVYEEAADTAETYIRECVLRKLGE